MPGHLFPKTEFQVKGVRPEETVGVTRGTSAKGKIAQGRSALCLRFLEDLHRTGHGDAGLRLRNRAK